LKNEATELIDNKGSGFEKNRNEATVLAAVLGQKAVGGSRQKAVDGKAGGGANWWLTADS